ncbi:hypothetical protein HY988_01250 [Candidatus Micrarchaeota archaeon]|nr:hypothetical protein [Candidatus Micrarchaeota archaeon]
MIYSGNIIGWYDPLDELVDYGKYCIDLFVEPEKQQELAKEISSEASGLESMFSKFGQTNLSQVNDQKLLEFYEELHQKWISWFVPGGLVEPVGYMGEKLIMEFLSEVPQADKNNFFALLTTTTVESFSKRELFDLLKIAVAKKEGKDVSSLLAAHAKKYYWTHNNYFSTEILDENFFEKELDLALLKYPDPAGQIQKMKNELTETASKKADLIKKLNLSAYNKNLIHLLDYFAFYQDYRKEYTMRMLHYLDEILGEIGRRKNYSLKEMKYTLAREIPLVLWGSFDKNLARERMKRCLFYFNSKTGKLEDGVGEWSIKKEKEIFHSLVHTDEVLEVSGMIANKGFVRGRAHVTMSVSEAKNLKAGEILITSMTTPDFVTAIKKAAAIVTNEGGILCHAAVISREFGIPCIVGTKLATKIFKTGDLLEVDGELGLVRKIKG